MTLNANPRLSLAGRAVLALLAMSGALVSFTACNPNDPQKPDWGLGPITKLRTMPDDPLRTCGFFPPEGAMADARASCSFKAGARATETLGLSEDVRLKLPIEHVILVMKENRSFDHMLGNLHERGQPETEAIPADYSNVGVDGEPVFPHHATSTCWPWDPPHQSEGFARSMRGGRMDGFVLNGASVSKGDGHFAASVYDESDLPFNYWLARTFALGDRVFAPLDSGTFANRNYLLFGTNGGVVDTGISYPSPRTPMLFHALMSRGHTWGSYSDGSPLSSSLDWKRGEPGVHSLDTFFEELDAGRLPNVAFVDAVEGETDDHPIADLQKGEAWTKMIYDRVVTSPQWERTVMFLTYDEGGAFADHVPPPRGCRADPSTSPFTQRGPRVPFIAISQWAKRNYVSHVVRDYTAVTRFIEALFGLPALTARDANADALFDLFDFGCGRDHTVPEAPAPGQGGCPPRMPE